MGSARTSRSLLFWRRVASVCFLFILTTRSHNVITVARDVMYLCGDFKGKAQKMTQPVTDVNLCLPSVGSMCEFLKAHELNRYELDPRLFGPDRLVHHQLTETCWPRRNTVGSPHKLIPAATATTMIECEIKPISRDVSYAFCPL